jgi:DNA transformation protein
MGNKGDQKTSASSIAVEELQDNLASLGDIRLRNMFGGYGVFMEDTMFALVDSSGTVFFKVDDSNLSLYEDAGSEKHGRMPYYRVPGNVLGDEETLLKWAQISINVSKKAK